MTTNTTPQATEAPVPAPAGGSTTTAKGKSNGAAKKTGLEQAMDEIKDGVTKTPAKKTAAKKAPAKKAPAKKASTTPAASEDIAYIPLKDIHAEKGANPREVFDREKLKGLASTIKQMGVIQPVIVTTREGKVVLVDGERRCRAARIAGLKEVPCRFVKDDPDNIEAMRSVANVHSDTMHPIEQARAMKRMLGRTVTLINPDTSKEKKLKLNVKGLAELWGMTAGWVSQRLKLLELPETMQNGLLKGRISVAQARELLTVGDEKKRQRIYDKVVAEGGGVEAVKKAAEKSRAKRAVKATKADGKKRGRPPKQEGAAPNISRQGLDTTLEHLRSAKISVRKTTDVRTGLATAYERFDRAKSESKKAQMKGMIAALEWIAGFRDEL